MYGRKNFVKGIFVFIAVALFITVTVFGILPKTNSNFAEAESYEIEFSLYFNDYNDYNDNGKYETLFANNLGVEEFNEYVNYNYDRKTKSNYVYVDLYAKSLIGKDIKLGALSGFMHFDEAYFNESADFINITEDISESDLRNDYDFKGIIPDSNWTKFPGDYLPDTGIDGVYLPMTVDDTYNVIADNVDTYVGTVVLKSVQDIPAGASSEMVFDFYDDGYKGRMTYPTDTDTQPHIQYNKIKSNKLYIGEAPAAVSADLSSLSLKGGDTEYINSFSTATTNYTTENITYQNNKDGLVLSYEAFSSTATKEVVLSRAGASYDDSSGLITGLQSGDTITINISDDGGNLTKTYVITVNLTAASDNVFLNGITAKDVNGTALTGWDKAFDKETTEYTLTIPYTKTEVTLTATADVALSKVALDGTGTTNTASKKFSNLTVGSKQVAITVTAETGDTKEYKVTITRSNPSSNTSLGSLIINGESQTINESMTAYEYMLAENKANFVFSANGAEPDFQKVEYRIGDSQSWTTMINDTESSAIPVNKNESITVTIKVTGQDESTSTEYTLKVTRKPSTDTTLSRVTVIDGPTSSTLTAIGGVYTYTISSTSANSLTVESIGKANENSTTRLLKGDNTSAEVVKDGIIEISAIEAGTYTYTIEVSPQDSAATKGYYTFKLIKKSSAKGLTITAAHKDNADKEIVLEYNSANYTYSKTVPFALDGKKVETVYILLVGSPKSTITSQIFTKGSDSGAGEPQYYYTKYFNSNTKEVFTSIITVTAEDGSTQTYNLELIRESADIDSSLKSLKVNETDLPDFSSGIHNYNTPMIFPANTDSVNVSASANSSSATIKYNNGTNQQISLEEAKLTTITVRVTAQSGDYTDYTFKVIAANDNNGINDITLRDNDTGKSISGLSFVSSTTEYDIVVDFNVKSVNIIVDKKDSKAKGTGDGLKSLLEGDNSFTVYVTSQAGTKGAEYKINIKRNEAREYKYLATLIISSDGVGNYISDFEGYSGGKTSYSIRVNHNVTSLRVAATVPSGNGSTILSGTTDNFILNSSSATISIVVQDEGGSKNIYTINVTRANDNNKINDIEIDVQNIDYSSSNYKYDLNAVSFSTSKIHFNLTLDDEYASIYAKINLGAVRKVDDSFDMDLAGGSNKITIYTKSEYGTKGDDYVFNVTRSEANTDTSLKSLSVKNGGTEYISSFSAETRTYNVRVDRTITSVAINAIPKGVNAKAEVTPPAGATTLKAGDTTAFTVTVTAESGAKGYYYINVIRANDNNTITKIVIGGKEVLMSDATLVDLGEVEFTVTKITATATLEDSTATVYGTGVQTLDVDSNTIEIYAISEYGKITGQTKSSVKVYTYKVTRKAASTNNDLEALSITDKAGKVLPFDGNVTFSASNTSYSITLDKNSTITEIMISATALEDNKKLSGATNLQSLTVKADGSIDSTFTITVTAQNGTPKNYTVKVTKPTAFSDDCSIKSVSLTDSEGKSYLTFNKDNAVQENVTIPYSLTGLTLAIELNDEKATLVSGSSIGFVPVNGGSSVNIKFQATAEDGTLGTEYTFKISRTAANTEKYLQSLIVKNADSDAELFTAGDSDLKSKTDFTLRVDDVIDKVIIEAAVPEDNFSKIISKIESTYTLTSGAVKEIVILVQAENGDTATYKLKITRANDDNKLAKILVDSKSIDIGDFTKVGGNYEYTLSTSYIHSVKEVSIAAVLEDTGCKATITGTGTKALADGDNSFTVYATSQYGTVGSNYVVRIKRLAASSDASLKGLVVTAESDKLVEDSGSSIKTEYNLFVSRSISKVNITADANHSGASVSGDTGNISLNAGEKNTLKIYVTAENGTDKQTIIIYVTVKDDDNKINDIDASCTKEINEISFTEGTFSYDLGTVPYDTEKVVFDITLANNYAVAYVNGNAVSNLTGIEITLKDNVNVIKFYAISERGTKGKEYLVTITRTPANKNTKLKSLTVKDNDGNILEFNEGEFSGETYAYTVELDDTSTIDEINIAAVADYANSVISGDTGKKTLTINEGGVINMQFVITVTAESGDKQPYMINVIKGTRLSSDFSIKSVSLTDTDGKSYLTFDSTKSQQGDVKIPYSKEGLFLAVVANDKTASVSGNSGFIAVAAGSSANISFKVIAQDGTEGLQYTFKIIRALASTEKYLESLTIKDAVEGNALLSIGKTDLQGKTEFSLQVNDKVNSITIDAVLPGENFSKIVSTIENPYVLTSGVEREISIIVQAEDTATKTYKIKILRANSDNEIEKIIINGKEVAVSDFNEISENVYGYNLPDAINSVGTIDISAVLKNPDCKAVISGNGIMTLKDGNNQFKVFATAQDGTKGAEYIINIKRLTASNDATLKTLSVVVGSESLIDHTGSAIKKEYNLFVERNVSKVNITATVNHTGAALSGDLGEIPLSAGEKNTLKIYVTAENGKDKMTYIVYVTVKDDNNKITNIVPSGSDEITSISFAQNTFNYDLGEVPYKTEKILFDITLENAYAKAWLNGTEISVLSGVEAMLTTGENTIEIYALSEKGTKGSIYTFKAERKDASSEAGMKSLKIDSSKGVVLEVNTKTTGATYDLFVERDISTVNVTAVASDTNAVISGDLGDVALTVGEKNILKIFVIAENGIEKTTYIINISVKDDDNTINDIVPNCAADINEINFAQTTYSYDLGTVAYDTEYVSFDITLKSEYAKVYVNGKEINDLTDIEISLLDNLNTVIIYTVSEKGEKGKEYSFKITRTPANTNTNLSAFKVDDTAGNDLAFREGAFIPTENDYTIVLEVSSKLKNVKITATAEYAGSTVTGAGTVALKEIEGMINNKFVITVTAESGDTKNYSVTIVRNNSAEVSDDNEIDEISLKGDDGVEYMTAFDKTEAVQTEITVPFEVKSLFMTIKAHEKAKINGAGLYTITAGDSITINFSVAAENGIEGTKYSVKVTRETAEEDNELTDFYYEIDGVKYPLSGEESVFNINISNTASAIIIGGTKPEKAVVTGLGTFTLSGEGSNITKVVTVTSESGAIKTYVLNLKRQSDDNTMKSIKIDGVESFANFVDNVYTVNMAFSKKSVTIMATANSNSAAVYGNGTHTLTVGDNVIEIYAESEVGTKGEIYTLNVVRETADNNNYLSSLVVKDTKNDNELLLQPSFVKTTSKYTIDLTEFPDITEIEIFAEAESIYAQGIEGKGKFILKTAAGKSSEIFTVTITAEDGTVKKYDITVTREVNPEDDTSVAEMSLIGSDTVNYLGTEDNAKTKFSINDEVYNVVVPYKTTNVTLTVINNNGAVVTGNGNYAIEQDSPTVIIFYLDSQSGKYTSAHYTINVSREEPSSEKSLSTLQINGEEIDGFDPSITSYELTVSLEDVQSINISAVATDDAATVIGDLGAVALSAGSNLINITVKAEDGTTQTYTLTVKRLSTDNALTDLGIEDYELSDAFNPDILNYSVTVPFTTDTVTLVATANSRAIVTGIGVKKLAQGDNVFYVYAISEQGVKGKVYTVKVTRTEVGKDADLKSLSVISGKDGQPLQLQPSFKPETTDYKIFLDENSDINSLTINAEANDRYAQGVGGTGYRVLKAEADGKYNNVFEITVMAQDSSTKTYTVSVYRDVKLSDDITIESFALMGSDGIKYLGIDGGSNIFYPGVYSYTITVPYNVESMSLTMQGLAASDIYGTGTKIFGTANSLSFEAYLVSQSGLVESQHYNITVNRTEALVNKQLSYIKVNGEVIEGFDPNVKQYEIKIPYGSGNGKVILSAAAADPTAKVVDGTGSFALTEGNNAYSIVVKAQDGSTASYNVIIKYLDSNAFLESLSLEGSVKSVFSEQDSKQYGFEFSPETGQYTIRIDKNINSINIKGAAQDQQGAAIVGLGKYTLEENAESKQITVSVISADGQMTKNYILNVVREEWSSDSKLKSLVVGGYDLTFNPDVSYYTLYVDGDTKDLDIQALARDVNATVTINGNQELADGRNAILITVKAEDGNTSVYQIVATKDEEPDYFLTILLIVVFFLWLLTVLYLVYKYYIKNKKQEKIKNYL